MLKKLLLSFCIGLLPLSAQARAAVMDQPEPIAVPAKLSFAEVEKIVKLSLVERDWQVKPAGSGKVEALYARSGRKDNYSVKIAVSYSAKQITIQYLDSSGLDYEEKDGRRTIHKSYNRWIGNLVKDLNTRMTQAEFAK